MEFLAIRYIRSAPFERPNQHGMAIQLRIHYSRASGEFETKMWKREFQGMDWMQDPPLHDISMGGEPTPISDTLAAQIISCIASVQLAIPAKPDFVYIHPTKYSLSIESPALLEIQWYEDLPVEWSQLQPAIDALEVLANA
jgi:hypothetical protein